MTYQERADRLAKTADIADKIIRDSNTIPEASKHQFLNWGQLVKDKALNPEPPFRKVVSIKFLENDFLIYWNESEGPDIDKFWKELNEKEIDFERKDIIQLVLKRKKIKNIHEYNYVTDNIVVAEQIVRIDKEQVAELNRLLSEFEQRQTKNKKQGRTG